MGMRKTLTFQQKMTSECWSLGGATGPSRPVEVAIGDSRRGFVRVGTGHAVGSHPHRAVLRGDCRGAQPRPDTPPASATPSVQSLRAGVVPRVGQHHIQVGRADEVAALMSDIDTIADGGAAARFVVGEYGAGKSFFLNLVRAIALRKDLVTVNADLAPQIRLHSSTGQARSLYAALMQSASTRSSPTGGAVEAIVERFIEEAANSVDGTEAKVDDAIRAKLSEMRALTAATTSRR